MNDPHANDCNCSNGCTVSIGSDVLVVSCGKAACGSKNANMANIQAFHAREWFQIVGRKSWPNRTAKSDFFVRCEALPNIRTESLNQWSCAVQIPWNKGWAS